jgi:D-amino peptidase
MKIYILADMEGISGIRKMEQVQSASSEYEDGRRMMMQDINVAVDGAFQGGATEVVVADTHGGGGQVRVREMDRRAVYETPGQGRLMPSLDESFDGLILLGHHARAGTVNGFLDHTMNSSGWFEYRINDQVVGEIGIEAAWAGHYKVPVIMVEGDQATAEEARQTLGDVECAIVKWGIGRNRAKCLSTEAAHQVLGETVCRAVRRAREFKPFTPLLPATIQLTFYRTDMCEEYAFRPGTERVNARTLRRTVHSLLDVCRW